MEHDCREYFEDGPPIDGYKEDRPLVPELWSSTSWEAGTNRLPEFSHQRNQEDQWLSENRDPYQVYDVDNNDFENSLAYDDLSYDTDGFGFEAFGCIFGQKCLMMGLHYQHECYTAEMAGEWYRADG